MIKKYIDNFKSLLEARHLKCKFTDPESPTEEKIVRVIIELGHAVYKAQQSHVSIVHLQFVGESN